MNKTEMKRAIQQIADGLSLAVDAWYVNTTAQPTVDGVEVAAAPAKKATVKKAATTTAAAPVVTAAAKKATSDFDLDDETPEVAAAPAAVEEKHDAETLRGLVVEYAKKNTKEKAWSLLSKYGAKKINEIDPKHYGAIHRELTA